ncbi:MAG: TspO protein, partial [Okeania sp. SIO2D1]|nr:TspO protein [Okeania sp. SIO2D1]
MTQSNDGGTVEQLVNTVMGVKTESKNQSIPKQIVSTKELDIKALLMYKLGTIVQIGIILLAFWGMEKLVTLVDR